MQITIIDKLSRNTGATIIYQTGNQFGLAVFGKKRNGEYRYQPNETGNFFTIKAISDNDAILEAINYCGHEFLVNSESEARKYAAIGQPPTPDQIREARGARSQTAAAALIGKPLRTWQNWEAPIESAEHRDMDPALFELFLLKSR